MGSVIGERLRALLGLPEEITLQDGTPEGTRVQVHAFTLKELEEMDSLEPGALTPQQYSALKLYMVMRSVPGYEVDGYDTWKRVFNGPALKALKPVAEAIDRVNASFPHRVPGRPESGNAPPSTERTEHPTMGGPSPDARAT